MPPGLREVLEAHLRDLLLEATEARGVLHGSAGRPGGLQGQDLHRLVLHRQVPTAHALHVAQHLATAAKELLGPSATLLGGAPQARPAALRLLLRRPALRRPAEVAQMKVLEDLLEAPQLPQGVLASQGDTP